MGVGHGRIEDAIGDVLSVDGVRAVITPGLGNEAGPRGAAGIGAGLGASARRRHRHDRAELQGVATLGAPSPWIGTPTEHSPAARSRRWRTPARSARSWSARPADRFPHRRLRRKRDRHRCRRHDRVLRRGSAMPRGRPVPGDRASAGGVRGGAAADRRGRQARRRAQVGTPRWSRCAALGATVVPASARPSTFSAMLRYYNAIRCDDFGTWLEHLEVFSRATPPRGRRIGAVTNSGGEGEYFADKAEQAGIPLEPLSDELSARIKQAVPNFSDVGNPADRAGDRRRPRRLPPRVPAMAESGEFDVLRVEHRPLELADRRRAGTGAEHRRRPPRRMQRHRPVPVRDHRDHGMPAGPRQAWAREHDIPMLKGSLPGLRALASRLNHRRRVPPARDVQPAEPLAGAGALAELDSAEVAAAVDVPQRPAAALRHRGRRGGRRRADRVPGGGQDRQRRPHKARVGGVALNPAGRLAGAGRGRAEWAAR